MPKSAERRQPDSLVPCEIARQRILHCIMTPLRHGSGRSGNDCSSIMAADAAGRMAGKLAH
jgi:hypothetical protein